MLSDSKQGTQIADGLHMGEQWLCAWDESADLFSGFLCESERGKCKGRIHSTTVTISAVLRLELKDAVQQEQQKFPEGCEAGAHLGCSSCSL